MNLEPDLLCAFRARIDHYCNHLIGFPMGSCMDAKLAEALRLLQAQFNAPGQRVVQEVSNGDLKFTLQVGPGSTLYRQ